MMTLGMVMDPIHNINPIKDSSFGLLLAAQARGWQLAYITPKDLCLNHDQPYAMISDVTVYDTSPWFTVNTPQYRPLKSLSVILMRQDPPVDSAYLHTTQILEKAYLQGIPVINRPSSLRDYNEKLFALDFPKYCPRTLVTQSTVQARSFLKEYRDIIVKPLDGMGGQSIFRVKTTDTNQQVIFETLASRQEQYFLLQEYLPAIQKGDKRIIMINGEPVPYGLSRIPLQGENRGNLAAGGTGIASSLTKKELEICQAVGPVLRQKGLLWVGLDVIGDYLTEINITSPTCINELEKQCKLNIYDQLLDCIVSTIANK